MPFYVFGCEFFKIDQLSTIYDLCPVAQIIVSMGIWVIIFHSLQVTINIFN